MGGGRAHRGTRQACAGTVLSWQWRRVRCGVRWPEPSTWRAGGLAGPEAPRRCECAAVERGEELGLLVGREVAGVCHPRLEGLLVRVD